MKSANDCFFVWLVFLLSSSSLVFLSAHHLMCPGWFSPDYFAGCKFSPVPWMIAADRNSRKFTWSSVDRMGDRSWENNVFPQLRKNSICIIEGGHGPSRIRQGQGTAIRRNLQIECSCQGRSWVGVNVVVCTSELNRSPTILNSLLVWDGWGNYEMRR